MFERNYYNQDYLINNLYNKLPLKEKYKIFELIKSFYKNFFVRTETNEI